MHSSWSERLWVGMETEKRTQTKGEEGKRVECPSSWVRMKGDSPLQGGKGEGKNPAWCRRLHPAHRV
jgi:hypothetical protein